MTFHPAEVKGLARPYPVPTSAHSGMTASPSSFSLLRGLYRSIAAEAPGKTPMLSKPKKVHGQVYTSNLAK
jgi:hypothetical protein